MIFLILKIYVFSHHPDLWRDLTLNDAIHGINYVKTWKDTYSQMKCPQAPLHEPIVVVGMYSDLLHRSWASRMCDLTTACPGFYNPCEVPRVARSDLSVDQFLSLYESKNRPVIITGIVTEWSAYKKWGNWEYLEEKSGNKTFRATSATASLAAQFTLSQYRKYCESAKEEAPLYFFDRDFLKSIGSIDYNVPEYFDPAASHGTDLFRLFGEHGRPDHRWLIIGPKRSGSMFHIDPNQTHAWNAAIKGRKKWIFYPPGVTPPGVMASLDGADVTMPISTGEWLLSFWSFHLLAKQDPDPSRRPIECILYPGELIFVPHNWWHMVINLDESIALTYNYLSSTNLSDCLYFLKHKLDQISGVRDRYGEAVQPDNMYNSLLEQLNYFYPHFLQNSLSQIESKENSIQKVTILTSTKKLKRKANAISGECKNNIEEYSSVGIDTVNENNFQIDRKDDNNFSGLNSFSFSFF